MISFRPHIRSLVSLLTKPTFHFSFQSAVNPETHEKIVKAKGNSEREFIIKPLTEEYIVDCARVIAHNFCNGNASYRAFELPEDLFMERLALPLTEKNMRENLGVICIEKGTGKLVGANLHEDISTQKTDPYYTNPHPLLDRRSKLSKLIKEENADMFASFPKGKYEAIYGVYGAVDNSLGGLGIYSQIAHYITFDHPILKKSKVMWCTCVHLGTYYGLTRCGWEAVWEKEWKEFADIKGYEEFAEVAKFTDASTERSKTDKIWLTVFDREKYEAKKSQPEGNQDFKSARTVSC